MILEWPCPGASCYDTYSGCMWAYNDESIRAKYPRKRSHQRRSKPERFAVWAGRNNIQLY
jgi:hypothetical protein